MISFDSVRQIGIIVDDLEETIKIYTEKFGCENWVRYKVDPEDLVKYPHIIRGEPKDISIVVAKTCIGALEFEFIQTIFGDTIYNEYLETQPRKNGIQHISFNTDDFPAAVEFLSQQYEVLIEAKAPSGWEVKFFDTYDDLGYAIEIQRPIPKDEDD